MDIPNSEFYGNDLASPFVDDHRRLRQGMETVGYCKSVGTVQFFSRDRYAWTGEELDYDTSDLWSGYFDMNRTPIYLNDLVVVKEGILSENPAQAAVLGTEETGMFLLVLKTGERFSLDDPMDPQFGWNSLRVIGQAYRHPGLWDKLHQPGSSGEGLQVPPIGVFGATSLVLWQLTWLGMAAGVQWKIQGSVGPLLPSLAVWIGAWIGLWRYRASEGPVLTRGRVRQLAVRSAAGMSAAGCIVYVLFGFLGWTNETLPQIAFWAPLLMGFVMGLLSLFSVLTAGDAYSAVLGTYDGEPERPKKNRSRRR